MLAIKLSKTGKTNKKMFRIVILEKSRDPYGEVLENLGSYNPHSKELVAKTDRITYWISKGAQMTDTVNNLLIGHKIIEGKKITNTKSGKPSEKRLAQIKAKADKKAAKAAEAPAAPAAAEEKPAEATVENA